MSDARTEAEADIDAAIAEAVEKTVANGDLQRTVTQYLIRAHRNKPPEERTSSVIDAIRKVLEGEDR